ncbi:MAG: Gfo/Idh/MocA family oxidoreductase [Firmicutes bacterium]|nr:Gfo/Idh/MocA family oxidoreductase [Bacillota bacterium]
MIRVAMLSAWHVHAPDYARQVQAHPQLSLAAVWDADRPRGEAWAQALGVPFVADLEAVLQDPAIAGVVVNAPTTQHRAVIGAALAHGKHVFSEKVLALTEADCDALLTAADAHGVQLMLSLPRLSHPAIVFAQAALRAGRLGTLTALRCRVAHDGAVPTPDHPQGWLPAAFFDPAEAGGGAFVDLGAHPIYLANRLAGPVAAVTACWTAHTGRAVEDNAVVVVEYASGALGVLETSFVSHGSPFQLALYGTAGTLLVEEDQVRLRSRHDGDDRWITPTLPAPLPTPLEQWVRAIRGEPPVAGGITREDMWALTQVNALARRSQETGRRVEAARG